ncbi:hypothetical protein DOLIC_00071 [Dolichomitus sp. PSUC_FEM 10030005]|nr:hypothetical protein [Dolichomitus sp. PSUC_FEM 10030005]
MKRSIKQKNKKKTPTLPPPSYPATGYVYIAVQCIPYFLPSYQSSAVVHTTLCHPSPPPSTVEGYCAEESIVMAGEDGGVEEWGGVASRREWR